MSAWHCSSPSWCSTCLAGCVCVCVRFPYFPHVQLALPSCRIVLGLLRVRWPATLSLSGTAADGACERGQLESESFFAICFLSTFDSRMSICLLEKKTTQRGNERQWFASRSVHLCNCQLADGGQSARHCCLLPIVCITRFCFPF